MPAEVQHPMLQLVTKEEGIMKKGRRLLTILFAALALFLMGAAVSFAATGDVTETHSGNTYTFTYQSGTDEYESRTFRFSAPDKEYDGQGYDSGADFTPTQTEGYDFYFNEISRSYNVSGVPEDVGTYTITKTYRVYRGTASVHHAGSVQVTVSADFEITPKPVRLYWERTATGGNDFDYVYNAQVQVPVAKIYASSLISGDSCVVNNVSGAAKNVGSHTAKAESLSNPNYTFDDTDPWLTKSFNITQKSVEFDWDPDGAMQPGTSSDPYVYEYDGNPHGPGLKDASVSGIIEDDDCSVTVSDPNINVGEYEASASLTGDSRANYTFARLQIVNKFYKITKQPITVVWDNEPLTYNGEVQYPEYTLYHGKKEVTDAGETVTVYRDDVCQTEETVKTDVGKTYYAKITLPAETNYAFAEGTETVHPFNNIQPYGIDVTWEPDSGENQKKITYDAVFHSPTAVVEDELFDVDSGKVKANVYIDGDTVQGERFRDEPGVVNTVDPETGAITTKCAPEIGVKDASSSNYRAKVEADSTEVTKGIVGPEAHNYVLNKSIYTYDFQIMQKRVSLEWFRPAYDEYGEVITNEEGEVVYVKVTEGDLNLVFNGQPQAPVAKIAENSIIEGDTCRILVEKNENAVRKGSYTTGKLTMRNKNYSAEDEATPYNIVPRPARLHWDAYDATYNGKAQKRAVIIDNIATTEDDSKYSDKTFGVVKVSKYTYTGGKHFAADEPKYAASWYKNTANYNDAVDAGNIPEKATGSAIAGNRTPIDAGVYNMTAAKLSDEFNYTLFKLTPDVVNEKGEVVEDGGALPSDKRVDLYKAYYTIHQYRIKKIDWTNTTRTYNASLQKPTVKVNKSNLQGPDTNKEVAVMFSDNKAKTKDNFIGFCNAKTYTLYVLKNDKLRGIKGTRSMNYRIDNSAKKMSSKFVINKRVLVVKVNNKTIRYSDDPKAFKYSVKYMGLVNGNTNKDDNHKGTNVPGKYTPAGGSAKKVVEGTLKYTTSYKKWGKPGKYKINASGLKSDNYKIRYVKGNLTVRNKIIAGGLVSKAKAGNKSGTISWQRVSGAAKYQIYFSKCNTDEKQFTPKLYKTVGAGTNKFVIKKLDKNEYYKFYVVALDKSGKRMAKSEQNHFCTNNSSGKFTNPKAITVSKSKVTVKKGATVKLKAKVTKVKKGKKLTNGKHTAKVRYHSENKKVAKVSKSGVITGVNPGWCRVYVMAANGIWKTVEVTVK